MKDKYKELENIIHKTITNWNLSTSSMKEIAENTILIAVYKQINKDRRSAFLFGWLAGLIVGIIFVHFATKY